MKQIIILLFLCSLSVVFARKAVILALKPIDLDDHWTTFKLQHGRDQKNKTLEAIKRTQFEKNLKKINELNEAFNNGSSSYSVGVNRFSDWTPEEFIEYINKGLANKTINPDKNPDTKFSHSLKALPVTVDWRQKGYVNPVKNQGGCGSCWAFSTVCALEGQYFKTNGKLLKFSEQNLVDCVYPRDGCDGGMMDTAFNYIKKNNGIDLATGYPYSSATSETWSGTCKYKAASRGAQLTGFTYVTNGVGDEAAVTKALAEVGPVSAALFVTKNFMYYQSGVFSDPLCAGIPANNLNHAINLVGYGSENGQDYYILRNSWDTDWGEDGYMRIARNKKNMCNIASYVSYPNVLSNTASTTQASTTRAPLTTPTTPKRQVTSVFNYVSFDASDQNINEITSALFAGYDVSQIKELTLRNNKIKELKANTFAKFKNLQQLNLFGNQISRFDTNWTNGLTNLKAIDLNNNKLSNLTNKALVGLENLEYLSLAYNDFHFTNINNSPFSMLTKLKSLDLTGNDFGSSISANSFMNLNKLYVLWLRESNVVSIGADAFKTPFCSPTPSKTIVRIAGNPVVNTNKLSLRNTTCYSFVLND